MGQQVMDASISFGTDAYPGIGLYRDGRRVRLNVLAADGSGRVDFVHPGDGDPEQSVEFLRALAEHALTMAGEVAGWPPADPDTDPDSDVDGPRGRDGVDAPPPVAVGAGVDPWDNRDAGV